MEQKNLSSLLTLALRFLFTEQWTMNTKFVPVSSIPPQEGTHNIIASVIEKGICIETIWNIRNQLF